MTAFSVLPPAGLLSPVHRDPVAHAAPSGTVQAVQPTTRPMLPTAIDQPRPTETSVASFLRQIGAQANLKDQPAGPPPAFQVSLLQQIRDTSLDPEPPPLPAIGDRSDDTSPSHDGTMPGGPEESPRASYAQINHMLAPPENTGNRPLLDFSL